VFYFNVQQLSINLVCLQYSHRPSSEDALRHVFVAEFHNEEDEPIYPDGVITLPIDDNVKLTAPQYRERLYQVQLLL
jgi:hypothetical protein